MSIDRQSVSFPIVNFYGKEDKWQEVASLCRSTLDDNGITRLQQGLRGKCDCVIVEYDYIDKDYRNTYSYFHSKKFVVPHNRTIRLHFFDKEITRSLLIDDEISNLNESYLGYSIIRPIKPNCIGRTMISQKILSSSKNAYVMTCQEKVLLQDKELEVIGFPFASQQVDATTCAQTSIWIVLRYYSNRYSNYPDTFPFDITLSAAKTAHDNRDYPYAALHPSVMINILKNHNIYPVTMHNGANITYKDNGTIDMYSLINIYINSGIPVILLTKNHALVAFGHSSCYFFCEGEKKCCKRKELHGLDNYNLVTDYFHKLVIADDNRYPYQFLDYHEKTSHAKDDYITSVRKDVVASIIPLPERVFVPAEAFISVTLDLLKKNECGKMYSKCLREFGKINLRILLSTGKSFKKGLSKREMPEKVYSMYKDMPMPHFIWICEFVDNKRDYKGNTVIGELLWDATCTTNFIEDGLLAIHYPEVVMYNTGFYSSMDNKSPEEIANKLDIASIRDNFIDNYDIDNDEDIIKAFTERVNEAFFSDKFMWFDTDVVDKSYKYCSHLKTNKGDF